VTYVWAPRKPEVHRVTLRSVVFELHLSCRRALGPISGVVGGSAACRRAFDPRLTPPGHPPKSPTTTSLPGSPHLVRPAFGVRNGPLVSARFT